MKRRVEVRALVEDAHGVWAPAPGQKPHFYGVSVSAEKPDEDGHYDMEWVADFNRENSAMRHARNLAAELNGDFDETVY